MPVGWGYYFGMSVADPPPGGSRRRRRRLGHHLLIGLAAVAVVASIASALPGPPRERLSLATAYAGLAMLAATLAIGPLRILRGRATPVSFDLRRDLGIWSAVLGLVHTGLGLTIHFAGQMWLYFMAPPDAPSLLWLRVDPFGAANHAGLIAALLLILLAAISNDRSLRRLGTTQWRRIQRWSYLILALTIVHGALYQVLEKRCALLVVVFLLVAGSAVALQLAARRRRRSVTQSA